MHFEKIIVCTDLSSHSTKTLGLAAKILPDDQNITLVTVVADPFLSMATPAGSKSAALIEFRRKAVEEAEDTLKTLCRSAFRGECRPAVLPCPDSPAQTIVSFAREEAADLIVIGSHGAGGALSLFLGTTAQRILAAAPCPVLLLPERAEVPKDGSGGTMKRILIATDLSAAAEQTLASVRAPLSEGDELLVLSVLPLPGFLDWQREFLRTSQPLSDYFEDRSKNARTQLTELTRRYFPSSHARAELIESEEAASEVICREADRMDADCIVMGSAGAGILGNLFLGSTLQAVIKLSTRPLLVIPTKRDQLPKKAH